MEPNGIAVVDRIKMGMGMANPRHGGILVRLLMLIVVIHAGVFRRCTSTRGAPDRVAPVPGSGLTVLSPNGGERYSPGDTIRVTWRTDCTAVNDVMIYLQLDEGVREVTLTSEYSIVKSRNEWEDFSWLVPENGMSEGKSVVSDKANIWIHQYGDTRLSGVSDDYFTISAP